MVILNEWPDVLACKKCAFAAVLTIEKALGYA
jgi:hypothetical protein